jgi:PAS domain S-box-containing protein
MARPSKAGGKTSAANGRKAGSPKGRKPGKTKRRIAPAAIRSKRSSGSSLGRELKEAREQQAATAEILKVIASSTSNVQPVFDAIAKLSNRLIGCSSTAVFSVVDDMLHLMSFTSVNPAADAALKAVTAMPLSAYPVADAIRNHEVSQISDTETGGMPAFLRDVARQRGWRSALTVPMVREGELVGTIAVTKVEPGLFDDHHVKLLQTFADQAVIAIQNTRLFNETKEALARQTATADVLKVIASSPSNLQPVFDAIAERSKALIGAHSTVVVRYVEGMIELAAFTPVSPEADAVLQAMFGVPRPPTAGDPQTEQVLRGEIARITDAESELLLPLWKDVARARGWRSRLLVPLKDDTGVIGWISITRKEAGAFAEKHVELLQTFADQAVIAIGNVHLFEEVQARTRDLEESLQQQTATAEVLQVINSSTGHVEPVFAAMLKKATQLCEAAFGILWLTDGEQFQAAASHGVPAAYTEIARKPISPLPTNPLGRMLRGEHLIVSADVADEESYRAGDPVRRALVDLGGARSVLQVALIKDEVLLGSLTVYRQEVRPFSDKQIALLQNFAAQAAIAIENTRLLNETKESLEQQTATSEVLQVINSSPGDLKPVFDAMLEKAMRLCDASFGGMAVPDGELVRWAASRGVPEAFDDWLAHQKFRLSSLLGPSFRDRSLLHVLDVKETEGYRKRIPSLVATVELGGARTCLLEPLVKDDALVGVIVLYRQEVRAFSDKQIALLQNFAAQAVIAIENARLFEELRDRQAELRVTFDNMGDGVVMFDAEGRLTAWNRNFEELIELPESFLIGRPTRAEYFRYLADRGEFVSADLEEQIGRTVDDTGLETRYERTRPDGRIMEVRRNPVPGGGFVLIYADITERKRAEEAIRAARDAAEKALRELHTAQDRLVQTEKLASLGQLTAGIAHEIKNPLNFVNNFSAVSAELVDEMNDVLEDTGLGEKKRKELDQIRELLKSNLEKVVQHGKRADSIVKNMLLHSRSGSGEHRSVEINAIVEESLNLAYHGARAEGRDFNITLERDFDQAVGVADIYPQEITRVLLNLISNGLYAATQRAAVAGNGFEPKLKAITRNLGDKVEIRIRDNGMGIPPDIREKIFNPFFTTKPAGEGTGLGLSMSHDIVVKQHGGTIEVVTEPGSFSEFIISLPRVMSAQAEAGRQGN